MSYKYGWLSLINSAPICICDFASVASIYQSPNTAVGSLISNTDFNTPTGGSWIASPISINSEPTVVCLNVTSGENTMIVADSLNMKIQMANLNAPPPLQGLVFLIGNPPGRYDYQNIISLNFGASSYTYCEISLLENSVKPGSTYGNIPSIDFDRTKGPFTGIWDLNIMFTGYYGPLDLGIRLESTTNQSSIFGLRTIIMPPDFVLGDKEIYADEMDDLSKYLEKTKKAKKKKTTFTISGPTGTGTGHLTTSDESSAFTVHP